MKEHALWLPDFDGELHETKVTLLNKAEVLAMTAGNSEDWALDVQAPCLLKVTEKTLDDDGVFFLYPEELCGMDNLIAQLAE